MTPETMPVSGTPIAVQWQRLARVLARRRRVIVNTLAVTFLIVAVGTELQPRTYRGTATVFIDIETPNVLAVRDVFAWSQANYLAYEDYYRTQLEIIRSASVARRVYEKLGLASDARFARAREPIEALRRQIKVEPVKDTRLARVHAVAREPAMAQRLANEFATVYAAENLIRNMTTETSSLLKNEHLRIQSQLAEYSKRYKEQHPKMVRLRAELAQLNAAMETQIAREATLESTAAPSAALGAAQPEAPLGQRLTDTAIRGGLQPNNIHVQDLAEVPQQPYRPRRLFNWAMALVVGLAGGLGSAAAAELMDNTIKLTEDLEHELEAPVLATIPSMNGLPHPKGGAVAAEPFQRYRYVEQLPRSEVAEAYRVLRTGLLFTTPAAASSVVVTSPGMQEGKSTTVVNLGVTLAASGTRVLLVDADLRRSKFHHIFHVPLAPGLSEFLVGASTFDEIARATDIPNLFVVTSGARPPNPAELLGSTRLRLFLEEAQARYGRVLCDTPPMLAVTDATLLAAVAKQVVLVVKSGRTPRPALKRVDLTCREAGAKVVGVVMNDVPPLNEPYYASYAKYYKTYTTGTYTKPGHTRVQ